jgi:protein-S-isoprenylcysteine O-methyltransferase Ste14
MYIRAKRITGAQSPQPAAARGVMTIAEVQIARKRVLFVAVLISVALFAVSNSSLQSGAHLDKLIEWAGIAAIIVCIIGRTWCSLYIGGRKIEQLVTLGPYSIIRNPLYFFSILGAAGIGAQHGSAVTAFLFGLATWLILFAVVLKEERLLAERYGATFAAYKAAVPRFLPDVRLWHDAPTLTIMPPKVLRTFADATFFLLSIPLADALSHLQQIGVLPILFRLP